MFISKKKFKEELCKVREESEIHMIERKRVEKINEVLKDINRRLCDLEKAKGMEANSYETYWV